MSVADEPTGTCCEEIPPELVSLSIELDTGDAETTARAAAELAALAEGGDAGDR